MTDETPVSRTLARIGKRDLVQLFDSRAAYTTILNWKAGRRNMPAWAITRLRQHWHAIDNAARADLDQIKQGPGQRASAINLARYRARIAQT